jgi:hypothetical protein
MNKRTYWFKLFQKLGLFSGATFAADTKKISFTGVDAVLFSHETPTGTVDGSNTVFTLGNAPDGSKHWIDVNGIAQKPTTDYSIAGTTITFVVAPPIGAVLDATYFTAA